MTENNNLLGKFYLDGIPSAHVACLRLKSLSTSTRLSASAWDESFVSGHGVNVPKRTLSSSTQATKEIDSLFDDIDFSCCRKHSLRS